MSNCTWENWAGSLYATPADCENPTTVADVQSIINNNQGKTIRAAGTGHSWSPLVPTESVLINPRGITENGKKAWRWQKNGMNLVTVTPAASWIDVRNAITETNGNLPQMAFASTGVIPSINATGFIGAGCHGTGWNQPTVSDFVYEMEIVSADGKVQVFSEDTTPDEMAAVRVNLGMLGIITKITFKVEEMFNLYDQENVMKTSEVMGPNPASNNGVVDPSKLAAMVTGNEYVELFWFPWSGSSILHPSSLTDGSMWVKRWNRTTDPVRDAPSQMPWWMDFISAVVMEQVAENTPVGSDLHGLIPVVEWGTWTALEMSIKAIEKTNGFVNQAPDVMFYQDYAFPVIDLEIAIPIPSTGNNQWDFTNVVNAWYQNVNAVKSNYGSGIYPITVCQHARFIKNSQSWLSPAYEVAGSDTHYCYIEILSAYPKAVSSAEQREYMTAYYNSLVDQIGPVWINQMNGRPHWAKYWQTIPDINVASLYPKANREAFNTLRTSLDPTGMFMNDFLKSLNLFGS